MRRGAFARLVLSLVVLGIATTCRATLSGPAATSPDPRFIVGQELARDDFDSGLGQWRAELEAGGRVEARDGRLEIDVPGGCTVWFVRRFDGPLLITYEATAVARDGPHDRVSDLNCFWMATDARSPDDLFATTRRGKFSDYDRLRCYYVGLGGNANTTTRFRRYVGQQGNRPILPDHDLSAPEFLLRANAGQTIGLIAAGPTVEYFRDGRRLFAYEDPAPYAQGWFAFRTVASHFLLRHFRAYRLIRRGDSNGGSAD